MGCIAQPGTPCACPLFPGREVAAEKCVWRRAPSRVISIDRQGSARVRQGGICLPDGQCFLPFSARGFPDPEGELF
jgi:hypothetical protein